MALYHAPDGCRIYYELVSVSPNSCEGGTTKNAIILIPGLGGDGRFWQRVAHHLRQNHDLLIVDHRGAGRSDHPLGDYCLKQVAVDVVAIIEQNMDKLAGKAVHLVGHSAGGAVVQEIALNTPKLGASYVISSSWARSDARFRAVFEARAQMLEAGLVEAYQHLTHIFGYENAYWQSHGQDLSDATLEAFERLEPLSVAAARVRMLLEHDRLNDLARINAPVQIMAAQDDILIPPDLSRQIAHHIRGAKFSLVEGGHFHPFTRPREFARLIGQFVSEHAS